MATTRLNESIRRAFIDAVISDLPKVDYAQVIEDLLKQGVQQYAPKEVLTLLANPATASYVRSQRVYISHSSLGHMQLHGLPPAWVNSTGYMTSLDCDKLPDDEPLRLRTKVLKAFEKNKAQAETRDSLLARLRAVVYGCTTTKALREALPEFADPKYLPPDSAPLSKTLPALANLSADFIRAGWPKDKPRAEVQDDMKTGAGTLTPDPAVVAAKARKAAAKAARAAKTKE